MNGEFGVALTGVGGIIATTSINVILMQGGVSDVDALVMGIVGMCALLAIAYVTFRVSLARRQERIQHRLEQWERWREQDRALLADRALQESLEQMRRGQGRVVHPEQLREGSDDD